MRVIALAGRMGAGKDTAGEALSSEHGYTTLSFARPLKDLARLIFHYDQETLHGPSRLRNVPDPRAATDVYWKGVIRRCTVDYDVQDAVRRLFPSELYPRAMGELLRLVLVELVYVEALTPRTVLQRLGTEWGRTIDSEVWLHGVKTHMAAHPHTHRWALTDCRFPEEAAFVKDRLGGKVVWVEADQRLPPRGAEHSSEPTQEALAQWTDAILNSNGPLLEAGERVRVLENFLFPTL